MAQQTRRLAAVMFTDIVGYTKIMGRSEKEALELLRQNRKLHKSIIKKHNGKWLKEMGDGTLAIFKTSSDSVYCAGELINACTKQNITIRIGIHLDEITEEGGDVFGDGVNLAARIEPLAKSGQILVSESVHLNVKNKPGVKSVFIREAELKNIEETIKLYAIQITEAPKIEVGAVSFQEKPSESSIAVLPFVNMSNDPEQEFFCDGISEEIINTIVQYPNLKVSGRTSSFSFKGKNENLRAIGEALGVSKILEGSIRKMGNRIRITAQLIEASSGFHIWSNRYDRQLDDIFAIQDEIAEEIGNQLKLSLSKGSRKSINRQQTNNVEAYELYLKGRAFFYNRGGNLFEALQCFENALKIDKGYALASAGLCDTYVMLMLHGYLTAKDHWPLAIIAANDAKKNGPELAESYNSSASIALFYEWDWDKAESLFKKAIEINPSFIQAYVWYGYFHQTFIKGEIEEGIELISKAIEIDPLSGYPRLCLANVYLQSNIHVEEAIKEGKKSVLLDPTNNLNQLNLGSSYLWTGKLKKAEEYFAKMKSGKMWLHVPLQLYLKINEKEKAQKIYDKIEMHYLKEGLIPTTFAIACAAYGNNSEVIKALEKALDVKDPALILFAMNNKDGEILHSIPGYNKILEGMGIK